MGRRRARFAALVLAITATTSACLGGGSGSTHRASVTTTTNGPGCQFIVASEAKRVEPARITEPVFLTSATATPTVCYDKVTFVFATADSVPGVPTTTTTTMPGQTTTTTNPLTVGYPPGYTVQYVKPPFAPGLRSATEEIPTVNAILEVTISPAAETDTQTSRHVLTYDGPLRLPLSAMAHTDSVELLSSFPQAPAPAPPKLVWLIGLDAKRPFTTDYANDPPRLSILIMN